MKKLVCGCFGTIYYATILKNGIMSDTNRVDVTDDAVNAVMTHLLVKEEYCKDKLAGYKAKLKDGSEVQLCLFDRSKYKIVAKEDEDDCSSSKDN